MLRGQDLRKHVVTSEPQRIRDESRSPMELQSSLMMMIVEMMYLSWLHMINTCLAMHGFTEPYEPSYTLS
jgi:hypothetical protein